jgi:hypothetical protein
MALVVLTLKDDLVSVFNSMNGDDKVFSEKMSAAIKKYAESGSITTSDKGGVPAGAYVGAGTGKITVNDSICEKIIYAACIAMRGMSAGGNAYLAAQLATGVNSMVAAGQVKTNVTGVVTPPGSSPSPLTGTATGTMTGVPAAMQTAFISAFNSMDSMKEGNDDYMAQQVSAAIDAYLKACVINTSGDGALSGSTGTGKIA